MSFSMAFHLRLIPVYGIPVQQASEYDKEIPQSHIIDQPMAPRGRDTEHRQLRDRTDVKPTQPARSSLAR